VKSEDLNSTTRFAERVEDYVKFRPSYPATLLDYLNARIGGLKGASVADIGAGTGIFSRLLIARGAHVTVVEPNAEMLKIAIKDLGSLPEVKTLNVPAENTGIGAQSVELITCAQAFHWFDHKKARKEFDRILTRQGHVALIWNYLDPESDLNREYEKIKLKFSGESLRQVNEITNNLEQVFDKFFEKSKFKRSVFDNFQDLDGPGLVGRYFSSSYAPAAGSPMREPSREALNALFSKFQKNNIVRLEYKTELYLGH
jgi:ubiquinone/menaquinone biosynthesis C-methylase UbiE